MSIFNTSKNSFLSIIQLINSDFHAFASLGIARGSRNAAHQKKMLLSKISSALDGVELDDVGIRVILLKTKE